MAKQMKISLLDSERLKKITALVNKRKGIVVTGVDVMNELGLNHKATAHSTIKRLVKSGHLKYNPKTGVETV